MLTFCLALISALLLYLSSPGPGCYLCAWFALVPLFLACRQSSPAKSALLGLTSGLVYYTLLLRWVIISLENYGHLAWWISWPALLLLAAYMSLYLAFFSWITSYSVKRSSLVWGPPVIWISLDFLRGFLFSGFPWQDLGYSQYSNPLLIQVADLAGHYGVTFLIVLVNTIIFYFIAAFLPGRKKFKTVPPYPFRQTIAALILLGAALFYSFQQNHFYTSEGEKNGISAAIIQGSIDQGEKWREGSAAQTVDKYIELSNEAAQGEEPDLMIWPETTIPFLLLPDNALMEKIINETVGKGTYSLLTGMPYFKKDSGRITYYNSALLIRPDFSHDLYHKQHLVPYGEYIPFKDFLNLPGPLVQSVGNFSAGKSSDPLPLDHAKIGILICFESIFPELARREVSRGADILVNITNDAWFGYSDAPIQHMAMAVFRAVENRRALARAANSGISCFISPSGHLKQATRLFEPCFIKAELPLLQKETFYNRYGHIFAPFCLILSGLFIFLLITRPNK